MAPLNKVSNSKKHMVKISGKRTIDEVNQDWQKIYEPSKRQCVRDTPAKLNEGVEAGPGNSSLKRKSDSPDREGGHDQPKKRVKIPRPDNPDVREIPKRGDPEFDFDLNRIFKGTHGPAFQKGSDAKPKPVERRQDVGTESTVITTIPGIGRKLAPLELLPAEVLQQILGHLLGDRTLHIELGRGWKKNFPSAKRSYAVCRNPDIEYLIKWHGGYVPYKQCHEACCSPRSPELYNTIFDGKLHLSILRASPLLYREGSAMLWSTNKFAFDNPHVFTDFMRCVGPTQSIRKLELSYELQEGVLSRRNSWNRIIQQDEALLDWGLQGRKPFILDALKSLEHLELHFHQVDRMGRVGDKSSRAKPPRYDEELHKKLCSAFGDLRALENVGLVKTYASMQVQPVPCNCVRPQNFVFDEDDEAIRHLHAHRIPRVEESFNSEIRSVLGPKLIQSEEDFREQRQQIFRLRTEAFEREQSLDSEHAHLELLKGNEQRARVRLLAYSDEDKDGGLTARSRAHDAVAYKYKLAYSLAEDKLNQKTKECEEESKAIGRLSGEAAKRQRELRERWGKMAGKDLGLEIFEGESEISSGSD